MSAITNWFEHHMGSCFVKQALGFDCPGCGLQRSLVCLLKGNILDSILLYPALIPMMMMIGLLGLHLIYKFKKGAAWLSYLFILNAMLILGNFVIKLIAHHP